MDGKEEYQEDEGRRRRERSREKWGAVENMREG